MSRRSSDVGAPSDAGLQGRFGAGPTGVMALLWGLPPVLVGLVGLAHGPDFIDDAYITFRHAENLAAGHGLVFNPGEAVLGTSTVLYGLILGVLGLAGASVPLAAQWLGLLSTATVAVLVVALARRSVSWPAAAALGVCFALHPDAVYMTTSGMETGLSLALVLGALLLSLQGRWAWAGVVGGAALLVRPDGVLVIALAVGLALLRAPRQVWRVCVASAGVVLPWVLYAATTYGSPLPHSVQAKQLIHPEASSQILAGLVGLLTVNPPLAGLFALGMGGVVLALIRRSELTLLVLWMGAYTGSIAASGIAVQFPWYVTPLSIAVLLMAAYGADQAGRWASERLSRDAGMAGVPAVLLLLAGLGVADTDWGELRLDGEHREDAYRQIGAWLQQRADPGEVVFVGEVGLLSYLLLDQIVVDSAGINSPEVFRLRQEDQAALRAAGDPEPSPEGSWQWVVNTIELVEPDYIVTKYPWLHIGRVEDSEWFQSSYVRTGPDDSRLSDYRVYERL